MKKLYDVLDIIKVRVNELEELIDDLEVDQSELSKLRLENDIKDMVDYWLEKDFNELKDLIQEVLK